VALQCDADQPSARPSPAKSCSVKLRCVLQTCQLVRQSLDRSELVHELDSPVDEPPTAQASKQDLNHKIVQPYLLADGLIQIKQQLDRVQVLEKQGASIKQKAVFQAVSQEAQLDLEEILGYHFVDTSLKEQALSHP
jgi:hypothetical protein